MYIDAHTHLNDDKLYPDWQLHAQKFAEAGGRYVVVVGTDHTHNQRAIKIAKNSPLGELTIKATAGIHPGEVSFGTITTKEAVASQIEQLRILHDTHPDLLVAVGECGLDAHYPDYEQHKPLQYHLFEEQCKLAQDLDLPIVIHSRDQFPDTLAVLKQFADLKIYLHCWGYRPTEIEQAIEALPNLWIGWCGNVTFKKATDLQDSLKSFVDITSGTHLLLETDAPYLTPMPHRGTTNSPAQIVHTYMYVAELLERPIEKVATMVQTASQELFG